MIILNLTGGLGNQLFQIHAALSLANFDEEIEVEWGLGNPRLNDENLPDIASFTLPERINLLPKSKTQNIFLTKVLGFTLRSQHNPGNITGFKPINLGITYICTILFSLHYRKRLSLICPKDLGFVNIDRKSKNVLLNGYFQSYIWPESVEENIIRSDKSNVDEYKELAELELPIVVHVRRGDYKNEAGFGLLGSEYYRLGLQYIYGKTEFRNIWLFSDEPEIALQVVPPEYRKLTRVFSNSSFNSADTLRVMSLGKAFVIANSTFSWWAAFASNSSVVVAPTTWFREIEDPLELIPPTWRRIYPHYE